MDWWAGPDARGSLPAMGKPSSFDDYPKLMTSAEVTELFLIGRVDSVERMAREGRIPAHRNPGARQWWFQRDELIAWLHSEGRVVPAAE